MRTLLFRPLTVLLAALLVLAACGDDDDDQAAADGEGAAATSDAGDMTQGGASTGDEDATTGGTGAEDDDSGGGTAGSASSTAAGGGSDASGPAGGSTTPAGASSSSAPATATSGDDGGQLFTPAAGEKPIPRTSLVYVRPVTGAVYTYTSSSDLGGGSVTYTVGSVTERGGGLDVDVALHTEQGGTAADIGFTFRYLANGTIQVPNVDFSSATGGALQVVEQPNFTFLDRPAVDAGTEFTGSTTARFVVAGTEVAADYAYVGRGLGRQSVSVPAGTFDTTAVQIDVTITINAPVATTVTVSNTYYLDDAIGLVRSTYTSDLAGAGSIDLVDCSLL